MDGIGKLRARGDGNRWDTAINKTMLKSNNFKHEEGRKCLWNNVVGKALETVLVKERA